jgi:hypothetical protein
MCLRCEAFSADNTAVSSTRRHFLKFDAEVDRRGVTFGQARAPLKNMSGSSSLGTSRPTLSPPVIVGMMRAA